MLISVRYVTGVRLTATSEVVVYGLNKGNGTTDAFIALPTSMLGTDYYAVTYNPHAIYRSLIGIVATQNTTTVNISIPHLHRGIEFKYNNITYSEGDTMTVILNAGDTIQLEGDRDMTGVHVISSADVVLLSGDTCTLEIQHQSWNDHYAEQILPTRSWGSEFIAVPFSTRGPGDIFRVKGDHWLDPIHYSSRYLVDTGCPQYMWSRPPTPLPLP